LDWFTIVTWLEMRSSQTESAIWMAFGLWVTEIAFILNLSLPYKLLAWVTASLNTCSYLFWLRTAPIFTVFGSHPPLAQEHEMRKANRTRRILPWMAEESIWVARGGCVSMSVDETDPLSLRPLQQHWNAIASV